MKKKKIVYGTMPVRKYKKGNMKNGHGHYHIIIDLLEDNYISVGLTSDKPNNPKDQKLHIVYESNNKIARLKSSGTIDKKNRYSDNIAKFNVDVET
jgi:hypothetical protein